MLASRSAGGRRQPAVERSLTDSARGRSILGTRSHRRHVACIIRHRAHREPHRVTTNTTERGLPVSDGFASEPRDRPARGLASFERGGCPMSQASAMLPDEIRVMETSVVITFRLTRAAKVELHRAASLRRCTVTNLIVAGLPPSVIDANRKRRQSRSEFTRTNSARCKALARPPLSRSTLNPPGGPDHAAE